MNKIIYILFIILFTSCAVTYEVPKCELMLRGQECLTDHRCCNPPQAYNPPPPRWNWWYWNKPYYNKTNYIIVNKPNNNNKPNRPNNNNKPNRPNRTNKHRK